MNQCTIRDCSNPCHHTEKSILSPNIHRICISCQDRLSRVFEAHLEECETALQNAKDELEAIKSIERKKRSPKALEEKQKAWEEHKRAVEDAAGMIVLLQEGVVSSDNKLTNIGVRINKRPSAD